MKLNTPSNEELLEKKLTYHEFCDLMTDAWLEAEAKTKVYPPRSFRLELFNLLEGFVKDFEP